MAFNGSITASCLFVMRFGGFQPSVVGEDVTVLEVVRR